jgi:hypothetical protein
MKVGPVEGGPAADFPPPKITAHDRTRYAEEVRMMAPAFEIWQTPGGKCWEGQDQEEAILTALRARRVGALTELAEVLSPDGNLHLRRIARYDDRPRPDQPM